MLGKFSLARFGLVVGGLLTLGGFVAYGLGKPTLNLIGFFYGIPVLLGGLALRAAELRPTPYREATTPEIEALRDRQATATQNQIRKDVTRYRYGQEAHLDESLERLGLSPSDDERPILQSLLETEIDGAYALVLEFSSPFVGLEIWQERQEAIAKFFGPDIRVTLEPDPDDEDGVFVALIATPPAAVSATEA
ncbi:DUF2854 domain-containing protein [Spirulina major CS-329]|uniref:DUF2854 domain-containing protein n=1 Tax=Spirulina TaxID=1154 RepID=UPI00232A8996|nr:MULTISPECIES: DUF2854 domain-containing protein [Spirulina]MDB9495544.1 DUF2854 domain-containing protein [Spirulina subsalsa CS-330]MDB9504311.1 DUF2854 domain-containing protein [Spirulina major CS-329]